MRRLPVILAAAAMAIAMALPAAATTTVPTPDGTWTAYPGQSTTSQATVQQPINTDGTSNFKANGKTVIPVKFALSQGTGAFAFQSIFSDSLSSNDYSFLDWASSTPFTFAQLSTLIATYQFTDGDCAGGSLRWTVTLDDGGTERNLDVHYQPGTGGLSQQTCAAGTSGANLIGSADTIYVTQAFNGTHSFPSSYNNSYADAVSQLGGLSVLGVTLIVDGGWGANDDQVVSLTNATVGVNNATPYTATFTPQPASAVAPICPTDQASVKISKTDGAPSGPVNEPLTIQPQDTNSIFRIVDCKYMYNLATSSLSGVGTYQVSAMIGSTTFIVGSFDLK